MIEVVLALIGVLFIGLWVVFMQGNELERRLNYDEERLRIKRKNLIQVERELLGLINWIIVNVDADEDEKLRLSRLHRKLYEEAKDEEESKTKDQGEGLEKTRQ